MVRLFDITPLASFFSIHHNMFSCVYAGLQFNGDFLALVNRIYDLTRLARITDQI